MTLSETKSPVASREFAVSLLGGLFREAAVSIPPEIAVMSVAELEAIRKPTENDYFLRKNFWKQVELAQKGAIGEIQASSVYGGVCSHQNFDLVMKNPHRMAWILTPPTADIARMEAGLNAGLGRLIEFVSQPVTKDTAGAFLKAIEILLNRVHGPVVQIQRVDKRSAHVNLNKPVEVPAPQDVDARLEELRQKILSTRDVTPHEQDTDPR